MKTIENKSFELIVILGATATGKTKLAVNLSNHLNGEIISADSRQIYKGLDIGTGKDYEEYYINNKKIPYHLIDIIDLYDNYSVHQFQMDFKKAYDKITNKNRIPILCGGTGLYIESILLDYSFMQSPPNKILRKKLNDKDINELINMVNKNIITKLNHSELNNKRRIIRLIEKEANTRIEKSQPILIQNPIIIGINYNRETIRNKITTRLKYRIDNGLIEEVQNLINNGISHDRLLYYGLEYKYLSLYLQNKIDKNTLFEKLNIAIHQFAKRQISWFKRMERRGLKINWVGMGNFDKTLKIINNFS